MRRFWVLVVLAALVVTSVGCEKKKAATKPTGPLVPTGREREVLRAFRLEAESDRGQRKIKELRLIEERVAEAQRSKDEWAEIAKERHEKEAN